MKILSIQVGLPKTVVFEGKSVTTGIFKTPVSGPVFMSALNLEGDGQADLKVHGGRDKAIYAYGHDTYPEWQALRPGDSLEYGAFGENLTLDELREDEVFVGDVYALGTAKIQACQPRFPCHKLGVKFRDPGILKQFMDYGRPGVYYRVVEEGVIRAGDTLELVEREETLVSITELFTISKPTDGDLTRVREILQVRGLADNWRAKLMSWIR